MICDIHQHVVYGVDDGAKDSQMSLDMLLAAAGQGVAEICCTSHIIPGYTHPDTERYKRHLSVLDAEASKLGIRLFSGSEIMYSEATPKLLRDGYVPCLGDSNSVLVEFMPQFPFEMLKRAAADLQNAGYNPVFAHIERYEALQDIKRIRMLRADYGIITQMNARTVLDSRGLFGNRWAKRVLEDGLIDVIASDAHNSTTRVCRIGEAAKYLKKKFGAKAAEKMTYTLPHKLLMTAG